ncbi:MAG: arsenate reductase ArsC [Betaproteobacteria bacterium]|jgi:arsenate reductase|nr:arsenate reductase ArsC [Betaproteobacteria bacterium]
MSTHPWNILILCTGNSARSILAEALFNALGSGRVRAFSAGSRPVGRVNPHALELLEAQGLDTAGLRSKSWDEFAGPEAPPLDLVVTVCGNAAGESCPVWPGVPLTAHWGVDDPAATSGDAAVIRADFMKAYSLLAERILMFLSLSFEDMGADELRRHMAEIGRAGAAAAMPDMLLMDDADAPG